jgi:protein kinase-like protein
MGVPMTDSHGSVSRIPERLGTYQIDPASARLGATGIVVAAEDTLSGDRVAVKIPNQMVSASSSRLRLAREARVLRVADAPFVVGLVEEDSESEPPYLVMEYVLQTIASVVAERGRLPASGALRITEQLAEALDHLHERGLVHRDLSPANVGLTEALEPRLLDFGIAVMSVEEVGESTAELGTPAYAAPERLTGTQYDDDPRTDLYSLGCLAYFMFEGAAPFEGADIRAAIESPRMAPAMNRTPLLLRPVIARLLEADPERRFQTAAEAIAALRNPSLVSWNVSADEYRRTGSYSWALMPVLGVVVAGLIAMLAMSRGGGGGELPPVAEASPLPTATSAPAVGAPVDSTAEPPPLGPIAGWSEIAFQPPLFGMSVTSTGRRVYMAGNGGEATGGSIGVWSAPIFENGTIGLVVEEPKLTTGRDGFPDVFRPYGMAVWNDCLYVLPATTNADPVTTVQPIEHAQIAPLTGSLFPFLVDEQLLNERRAGAALVAVNGYLYAVAGFQVTESADRRSVEFAPIRDDCSLGPWRMTEGLVHPQEGPQMATDGKTLYVVGGNRGDSGAQPQAHVQRATINDDGTLSPWVADPSEQLSTARLDHAVLLIDGQLVAMGGAQNTIGEPPLIQTASIEFARIRADGSLEPWSEGATLPEPRSRLSAIVAGEHVVLIDGTLGRAEPKIRVGERGLSSNLRLAALDAPVEVVDDAPPSILSIGCFPPQVMVGEMVKCAAGIDGRWDTTEWAAIGVGLQEGRVFETRFWAPLNPLVLLEVCNTAGCAEADTVVLVEAGVHFWETDVLTHAESVPLEGGEFKVSVAAGTQDLELAPDVVFRVTGPGFDEELEAEICAAARHAWGVSVCYSATFTIPEGLVSEPTMFSVVASAPLIDSVVESEFWVRGSEVAATSP